ncbi:MAG: DUF3127 domain-containing protein [Flavobacteriales bacterium]|nr:DUF3127 domain-containing protein [Flavobacteriales bacterium]
MSLVITGKITDILNVESGTSKAGKEWKKQNFVVDTGAQFNPSVCFNLFGEEKIAVLQNFAVGQEVEVAFNVSSREFNGKYYHNIDAWKINAVAAGSADAGAPPPVETDIPAATDEDDLPF